MAERAVLVVLAAGAGRRLGGAAKALLPIGAAEGRAGETYLARIAATARAARVEHGVVVVAPPHGGAVAAEARRLGLEVVENPQPERGMGSSVELGFAWAMAQPRAEAALLWPCDHPAVNEETVQQLLDEARPSASQAEAAPGSRGEAVADADADSSAASASASIDAVIPTVHGRGGHPALILRRLFPELSRCATAPEGARSVLRAARVRRLAVADAGCVVDVDDPAAARAVAGEGV